MENIKTGTSNSSVNWAKIYDFYEIQMRDTRKVTTKMQNESHFELLRRYLQKNILKNNSFAEIGFGSGITLRRAAHYFEKVYGLDISPQNVRVTQQELEKKGYHNIELFVTNIMKKEEQFRGMFDVITFIHGLEHFSLQDYQTLFTTIRYYLKPGGFFTGALPFNLDFTYRMCPSCHHLFEIDGHLSRHDIQSLTDLFASHEWEIIYLANFNPYYYWQHKGLLKFLYRFIRHVILKQKAHFQLEFIVKPK